jgi:hypothetical protein
MAFPALFSLGSSLLGAYTAAQGHQKQMGLANMPSEKDLRSTFSNSQDLINQMTNFNQYSGGAMDLATQAGNQGVETALQSGLGGSQANAIRNRLKAGLQNKAYAHHQKGIGDALTHQRGLDSDIFAQLNQDRGVARSIKNLGAQRQMGIGQNLMGPQGVAGLMGQIGGLFG